MSNQTTTSRFQIRNRGSLSFGSRNNSISNEPKIAEERKIKENLELLPEWLKKAVKNLNGLNYGANSYFIDIYQKIAEKEIEYFDDNPEHHTVNEATSLLNTAKNRYMNVYPYDYNRITLLNNSGTEEEDATNFINASLIINPYTGKESYIATQGPINETCSDFWQMVWERNVYLVVMVAREIENNVIKCAVYWPTEKGVIYELDLPSEHNNDKIQRKLELVLMESSQPTENIIQRKFKITEIEYNKIEDKQINIKDREVIHLQFIAWPDHDEPNTISSFVDLIKISKEIKSNVQKSDRYTDLEKNSLVVVHCSAGVGRTGTFITLDTLFDYYYDLFQKNPGYSFKNNVKSNTVDKIQECIFNLRKQRVMMVQSLQQLVFCYKALAYELIKFQLKK